MVDRDPAHGDPSLMGRLTKVSIYDQAFFPEGQDKAWGMILALCLNILNLLIALSCGSSRKNIYLTFYFCISSS